MCQVQQFDLGWVMPAASTPWRRRCTGPRPEIAGRGTANASALTLSTGIAAELGSTRRLGSRPAADREAARSRRQRRDHQRCRHPGPSAAMPRPTLRRSRAGGGIAPSLNAGSRTPEQLGVYAKPLPFARCELGNCRFSIADCRLPIADCRLLIVDCRLLTDIGRSCHTTFSIISRLPIAGC